MPTNTAPAATGDVVAHSAATVPPETTADATAAGQSRRRPISSTDAVPPNIAPAPSAVPYQPATGEAAVRAIGDRNDEQVEAADEQALRSQEE